MKSVTLKKSLRILLWSCIIFFSGYYIYENCLRYFVFTPKNYHFDFFWTRKYWVFIHIIFGMLATIVSPFQFITFIRKRHLRLHKLLGRIYVFSICISSITSFYLCATTPENIWYALGLGGFTAAWLFTAIMGMVSALKGRLIQHKAWVIRSFVVTIGFSISRLLEDMIVHAHAEVDRVERLTALSWISWIVPLLITEWMLIRNKKINNSYNNVSFAINTAKDELQTINL
ncbi:DUF2306 domain-containing protein [Panacibacter ginsenosidivorans]|uniref:DUF2306 domain-containing protein n=1 Tax=Panacibacter ginsenosidivorans TaxID=1813871 RepID=A0A5B8V6A8_9BACT|nr:DUF2306 domain-containing protein [Panacibacter ginsenosidivorans]QEC66281.1 DUF2306 domain-containing protein [Panacibacter ginsenosidivorans]